MKKWQNNKWLSFTAVFVGGIIVALLVAILISFCNQVRYWVLLRGQSTVKVLVLGDSIWDKVRDDTGIADRIEKNFSDKVEITNLTVQGSSASWNMSDTEGDNHVTCLPAMVDYLTGARTVELPDYYVAASLIQDVDIKTYDYVILAYGLNDYYAGAKLANPNDYYDVTTFEGAMCYGISTLKQANPNLKFGIISPTYSQGYSNGKVVHEGTYHSYGGGVVSEYVVACEEVAKSFYAFYVNTVDGMKMNIHNGPMYLEDATHLTKLGRRRYADLVSRAFLEDIVKNTR